MKIYKKHFDGFVITDPEVIPPFVKKFLKDKKDCYYWVTCLTGAELYMRESGENRISTQEEYEKFWRKNIKKKK